MTHTLRFPPFALLALALVGGCTVGPDYKGPPIFPAIDAAKSAFVRAKDPALIPAPGLARWWKGLADPTLSALIEDALKGSPTIEAAQARIREGQAKLGQQRANQMPSVSASATYLHADLSGVGLGSSSASGGQSSASSSTDLDFYNLGGTASWEPDLFGGGRRGIQQARATVEQSFADLADAQVSLTAQVAQAYVNYRDVEARITLNAQSSALQGQAVALTRQRYAAGAASQLDVERLQNQQISTDAQNIPLEAQADEYRNQLAVLTGRAPGALDATLATPQPVPLPPANVPIGDPALLIAQRPDVRSAERALAASTAAIGVNEAKRYPSLRFMGILGLGGTEPGDVLDPGNLTALIAPSLSWSFLDFGRTAAAVHQSEAQRDEAVAKYHQAVLQALTDAETSLSRFSNIRKQLAQLVRAEVSATHSADLNRERLDRGIGTTIDQLDIERQRLSATIAVAQAKAQLTNSYIAVQKSLGLGWQDADQRH